MTVLPVDKIDRDSLNQVTHLVDIPSRGSCEPVDSDTRRHGQGMLEGHAAPFEDGAGGKFVIWRRDHPLRAGSSVALNRFREHCKTTRFLAPVKISR